MCQHLPTSKADVSQSLALDLRNEVGRPKFPSMLFSEVVNGRPLIGPWDSRHP